MPQAVPDLWLFFVLVFGVIVLPGMDMAYIAGSTLTAGRRGGVAAVLGVTAGGLVHVVVATLGLAALLSVWPAGFNLMLLAGAAYMAWIGWSILRMRSVAIQFEATDARELLPIFGRAALTCLLNPKAYLFMLAVFPAFMPASGASMLTQAARLSAVIAGTQIAVYGAMVVLVASARQATGIGAKGQQRMAWAVGASLIAGAVATLILGWR